MHVQQPAMINLRSVNAGQDACSPWLICNPKTLLSTFLRLSALQAAAGELDVEAKEAELRCLEALAAGSEAHIYAAMHNYVQVSCGWRAARACRGQGRQL